MTQSVGRGKKFTGTVVSKNGCTINVLVKTSYKHPIYGKTVTRSKKYLAHDQNDVSSVGEQVTIFECAPISKRKCFRVLDSMEAK